MRYRRQIKEQIKHYIIRANALDAIGVWNEEVEEAYWKLKEELFESNRFWEYENPRFYWAQEMKDNLFKLHLILESVWHKQFA